MNTANGRRVLWERTTSMNASISSKATSPEPLTVMTQPFDPVRQQVGSYLPERAPVLGGAGSAIGAYGSGATSTSARCSAVARSSTACMTARSFSQKPSGTGCSAARVKP